MPAILGPNGQPLRRDTLAVAAALRRLRARYDAAQADTDSARHWANADSLSARAANDPTVRQRLRDRSRYEIANNSYARGIVNTIANDTIGTGPRLQLLTDDVDANRRIERAFAEWSDAIRFGDKLRTMARAKTGDGEAFALISTNPRLSTPVQLDLRLVEADQVATPTIRPVPEPDAVDGIVFDGFGNPRLFHVLREHPGDMGSFGAAFGQFDSVPAELVLHWFRRDRPGQARGVPDITPALPLFAELRRFMQATRAAAETAADFAAVTYTEQLPDGDFQVGDPFEELEINKRMLLTLPAGYKMDQFRPEQPATTYEMFVRATLKEIARCLSMPYNIASGDSSDYNYASGRLDHQTYYKSIRVEQSTVELELLDRVFAAWLDEASLATDLLPGGPQRLEGWPHQWIWDGPEHVDPEKEANAQETRLRTGMASFDEECYRQGVDPDTRAENIAKSLKRFAFLGIPAPSWAPTEVAPAPSASPTRESADAAA